MHDLQTIIKLNAPLNQRTDAATQKAYAIARDASQQLSNEIPLQDQVSYETHTVDML